MADLVALVVLDGMERACRRGRHGAGVEESFPEPDPGNTFWPQETLGMVVTCIHPLSYYSAEEARVEEAPRTQQGQAPVVQSGDWRLFEDVPGKPGWISSEEDSVILFPIRLGGGGSAAITISWLASYQGIGDAEARVYSASNGSDTSRVQKLRGTAANFSQAQTGFWGGVLLQSENDERLIKNDWLQSEALNQEYVLEVRTPPGMPVGKKVKLLEVTSC